MDSLFVSKLKMTDILDIKFFIGIRIDRTDFQLNLSHSAYIRNILSKFKMEDFNPVNYPLPNKLNREALLNSDNKSAAPSQILIGCLMCTMLSTRPYLVYLLTIDLE